LVSSSIVFRLYLILDDCEGGIVLAPTRKWWYLVEEHFTEVNVYGHN